VHGLHLALAAGAAKEPANREWLYTIDAGNAQLVQYELSRGGDVTSASLSDTLAYDSLDFVDIVTPRKVYAHPNGRLLYVIDYSDDIVHVLRMDSPHALSTAEEVDQIDASGEVSGQWDVALTSDATRMFLVDRGSDEVVGYQLPEPYDFDNRSRTGSTLELPAEDADPNGGWVFANDSRLALSTGAQSNLVEYRLRAEDVTTYNVTENTYSRVELHRKFPLGAFVLLLGVLMLMGSAGRASEESLELR
jgi:DNA-binding beta-propeller fold protein YncE